MIAPRDELARRVDAALEEMEAGGAVVVVRHVVFARPLQVHRHAGRLRDLRGLGDEVVVETTAEAAAHAHHVHGDVGGLEAERVRDVALPLAGVCVPAQISHLPSLTLTVAFIGSSRAWLRYG